MQLLIKAQLAEEGVILVGMAAGPADGLRMIDENRVDLVIADMFLDEGTAIEILEGLRQRHSKPAVIITTNSPSIELRERCLSLGASGLFDKAQGFDWLTKEIAALRRQITLQQAQSSASTQKF
jgi:DNA-binding NarL/FixJ family response regulator